MGMQQSSPESSPDPGARSAAQSPAEAALNVWPALPFEAWADTCETLHMWTQIVGKIRMVLTPATNHSWHVPLYLTCRGLTTTPMPYGTRLFEINFDFIAHQLEIVTSDGRADVFRLRPMSVAEFYRELMGRLNRLGFAVTISTMPNEVADGIPFEADRQHAAYEAAKAHDFWRALLQADRVLKVFRARFIGKASPVHFFWGSFDLAATRFSGRRAPPHPGGVPHLPDRVVREAYSQEVSSCGFWPGNGGFGQAAFYAYAYPEPAGFGDRHVAPAAAYYSPELREFILPYDAVRRAAAPDEDLLAFLQATYEAAAEPGHWDRGALEATPDML